MEKRLKLSGWCVDSHGKKKGIKQSGTTKKDEVLGRKRCGEGGKRGGWQIRQTSEAGRWVLGINTSAHSKRRVKCESTVNSQDEKRGRKGKK